MKYHHGRDPEITVPMREHMSAVDTAWLRMDRESNRMVIVGVLVLEKPVAIDRLRRILASRLVARFRRFRQRVTTDLAGAWWEDDPRFDLDNHLVTRTLPRGNPNARLQRFASDLVMQPLDPDRPLWRFDFIPNFQGGTAIVVRIHHCIADGIALVGVMLSLTDAAADAPARDIDTGRAAHDEHPNPWAALIESLADAALAPGSLSHLSTTLWVRYLELLGHPDTAVRYGRHGIGLAVELAKLLALPADSPTRFKGRAGRPKRVAWSAPIALDDVKAVGKPLGCSVNDVLLSAVAGALRNYLATRGDPVDGVEVRAMVPVNLRSETDAETLGNRFGLVTLLLPVGESNPFARLFEVRRRMNELKQSYLAPLSFGLLGAMGMAPKLVQDIAMDILAAKASAVMTNVPGPREPIYLAGSRIGQMMFWVPQSGDIGMGVSILSYADTVQFGLVTDEGMVPDPETITPLFQKELETMVLAMLLGHWSDEFDPAAMEAELAAAVRELEGADPDAPDRPAARGNRPRRAKVGAGGTVRRAGRR